MEFANTGSADDNANSAFCFLSALEPLCDSNFGVIDDILGGSRLDENGKEDASSHSESSEYVSLSPVSDNSSDFASYTHSSTHHNPQLWNTEYGFNEIAHSQTVNFLEQFNHMSNNSSYAGHSDSQQTMDTQTAEAISGMCALLNNNTQEKPKRKRTQSPRQRHAANIRERKRMFYLNDAFDLLRKRLPTFKHERTISRIQVLRLAVKYISFMKDCLNDSESSDILNGNISSASSCTSCFDHVQ